MIRFQTKPLAGIIIFFIFISIQAAQAQSPHLYSIRNNSHTQLLSGTAWKLAPVSAVQADGSQLSTLAYNDASWQEAIVPGTAFSSYIPHDGKPGVEAAPDSADNIYKVDLTKYDQNFWYRTTFTIPASFKGKTTWLNFEGINKKGDVYLNGKRLGSVDGLAQRAAFSFTPIEGKNVLAVLVHIPLYIPEKHNLANLETPTYICSAGWDWMPRVPGLNSGITDDVYLSCSVNVTIKDPWVRTDSLTTNKAILSITTLLQNGAPNPVSGTLAGIITPGNISFTKNITLKANSDSNISFTSKAFPQLIITNPKLWWPNGYGGNPDGTQPLYNCTFTFTTNHQVSDEQTKHFGIRRYSYDTLGGPLHVLINGKRVFLKGGNWGMSDYLLRCRGDEYETKIRFHKEMHFNIIRNWTGEVTDEEFYDACDKWGIMVWDDFWLNNLGPIDSLDLFTRNAVEKVKRYRNHPSIAIWCGANEGLPQGNKNSPLNKVIENIVAVYDGADRRYQPRSNAGTSSDWLTGDSHNLSGSGIWTHEEPKTYFEDPHNGYPWSKHSWSIRSEIGTAVFPNIESFKKFIPADSLWPRNTAWDKHFFSNDGRYGGGASPSKYMEDISKRYGTATGIEDFCRKAQLMNLETNKAMFEGWQENLWNDASGLLIWMSQSSYPSMIWQTYDFYYDLTGAYFGAKSACEPIHIQWNSSNDSISVINNTIYPLSGLTIQASLYNKDGKKVSGHDITLTNKSINAISKQSFAKLNLADAALSDFYFIRLKLSDSKGKLLSENNYWNSPHYLDYTGINTLPSCLPYLSVTAGKATALPNGNQRLTYTVTNSPSAPVAAFALRVQPMDAATDTQILPALISDSYFTLMQGESKTITIEFSPAALKSGSCYLKLSPYNSGSAHKTYIKSKSIQLFKK